MQGIYTKLKEEIKREEFIAKERQRLMNEGVPPSTAHALAEKNLAIFVHAHQSKTTKPHNDEQATIH